LCLLFQVPSRDSHYDSHRYDYWVLELHSRSLCRASRSLSDAVHLPAMSHFTQPASQSLSGPLPFHGRTHFEGTAGCHVLCPLVFTCAQRRHDIVCQALSLSTTSGNYSQLQQLLLISTLRVAAGFHWVPSGCWLLVAGYWLPFAVCPSGWSPWPPCKFSRRAFFFVFR